MAARRGCLHLLPPPYSGDDSRKATEHSAPTLSQSAIEVNTPAVSLHAKTGGDCGCGAGGGCGGAGGAMGTDIGGSGIGM
eukprot:7380100-Prymnesium_polylepis.2